MPEIEAAPEIGAGGPSPLDRAAVDYLNTLSKADYRRAVALLGQIESDALDRTWLAWAHDGQLAPATCPDGSDWHTWVLMAGRGFGKTLAGAQWLTGLIAAHDATGGERLSIALVGASLEDARRVMVEGRSGLLTVAAHLVDAWVPSLRRLTFTTGVEATIFSGASPDLLRGPEHHLAWCDELAKWERAEDCWNMLQFGLRLGRAPRALVTTTPRPGAVLRAIMAAPGTVTTRGRTRANPHLSAAWKARMEASYAGTRLGRQELDGELLPEAGALWTPELIERCRVGGGGDIHSSAGGGGGCRLVGGDTPERSVPGGGVPGAGGGDICLSAGGGDTPERSVPGEGGRHLGGGDIRLSAGGGDTPERSVPGGGVPGAGGGDICLSAGGGDTPERSVPGEGGCRLGGGDTPFRSVPGGEMVERGAPFRRAAGVAGAGRFTRTLIAVDPPAGDGTCGIVACARDAAGVAHVLADHSVTGRSPQGWARAVADAAAAHGTRDVVVETNQGGKMVKAVLLNADAALRVRPVVATVGKAVRAEPVAQLFEAGRVRLHGHMPELEAQLLGLIAGGGYEGPGASPDRADAMVWGVTDATRDVRASVRRL